MVRVLVLLIPALLLGLLVGVQWQTQAGRSAIAARYSVELAEAATDMQREQDALKVQLTDLRTRLDDIQGQASTLDTRTAALQREVEQLKVAAGLTPLSGAGIVLRLDDGRLPASAERRAIELAIVHSQDITDVFNAAWKAGALGISVNGERVTAATACVGATIQINGRLMSPPFAVSILGAADQLFRALSDPAELRDLKRRRDLYGLGLSIERSAELRLPAYTGPIPARHAQTR